jgi:hypothetical protein
LTGVIPFVEIGWKRATKRLETVWKAAKMFQHLLHRKRGITENSCAICKGTLHRDLEELVAGTINRAASKQVESALGKCKMEKHYNRKGQVWYANTRLEKEGPVETQDLDVTPFFDGWSIKKVLPVVLVGSEIFQSLLMHIHFKELPHHGVETTYRRMRESFMPVGRARAAINQFRQACSKCRSSLKKVVALELADFPVARTTIAPPFYAIQLDIAMGFSARSTLKSTKTFRAHSVVIVCLLTSATNILVIDGLTTQAVVQALERHAARYGVPGHVFVDAGTQLEKLQDTSFNLRDVEARGYEGVKFKLTVCAPKAHHQHGRVEAKIKRVREMLEALSDTVEVCNTLIGWETVFAKIADQIDNLPIARGGPKAASDLGWEIITPNRLKLGRNNFRQLSGNFRLSNSPQSQLERNRLIQAKWYELFKERVLLMVPAPQKSTDRPPQVGDVVLFLYTDAGTPKSWEWKLGTIETQLSRTKFEINYYSKKDKPLKLIERAASQIAVVLPVNELPPTHPDFFKLGEPFVVQD